MNIFYLDHNVTLCAVYHCDKHVVKMINEYTQILCTTHRIFNIKNKEYFDNINFPKSTHINHPSVKWARTTTSNYLWLYNLLLQVHSEYTYRYNRIHIYTKWLEILKNIPINIKYNYFIEPPLCMPDKYKIIGDAVASYRNYYIGEKIRFAKYKNRNFPYWLNEPRIN